MKATPKIMRTRLAKLRPTQMTVGFAEVKQKRRDWNKVAKDDREAFLENHAFPAVKGPGERFFITDHHHLGRALLELRARARERSAPQSASIPWSRRPRSSGSARRRIASWIRSTRSSMSRARR